MGFGGNGFGRGQGDMTSWPVEANGGVGDDQRLPQQVPDAYKQ